MSPSLGSVFNNSRAMIVNDEPSGGSDVTTTSYASGAGVHVIDTDSLPLLNKGDTGGSTATLGDIYDGDKTTRTRTIKEKLLHKLKSSNTDKSPRAPGTVVILILIWIVVGSVNGISQKSVLTQFHYPATLSMLQLTTGFVLSAVRLYVREKRTGQTEQYPWSLQLEILPVCLSQTLASTANNISVTRVSVALTQIVKSLTSVGTAMFSFLMLENNHLSPQVLCSLVPIIGGVAMSTHGDVNFEFWGFVASMCATLLLSFQGVATKRLYHRHKLDPLTVQYIAAKFACMLSVGSWLVSESYRLYRDAGTDISPNVLPVLCLHLFCHYSQVTVAFMVMECVHPLTYQVSNTLKRFCLIVASLVYFNRPVTPQFVIGFAIALVGMVVYSVLKAQAHTSMTASVPAGPSPLLLSRCDAKVLNASASRLSVPASPHYTKRGLHRGVEFQV